ncbi:hypothetical protein WJX81_005313 [Elliptochloris bilobata]|uniref:Uncharacterized protein n=1 Tax=Elliptochloris bilobata TaxID=381761 RepID=A0AAW1QPM5_9CHLO
MQSYLARLAEASAASHWTAGRNLKTYDASECAWLHNNECFIGSGAASIMLAAAKTSTVLARILRTAAVCSQKIIEAECAEAVATCSWSAEDGGWCTSTLLELEEQKCSAPSPNQAVYPCGVLSTADACNAQGGCTWDATGDGSCFFDSAAEEGLAPAAPAPAPTTVATDPGRRLRGLPARRLHVAPHDIAPLCSLMAAFQDDHGEASCRNLTTQAQCLHNSSCSWDAFLAACESAAGPASLAAIAFADAVDAARFSAVQRGCRSLPSRAACLAPRLGYGGAFTTVHGNTTFPQAAAAGLAADTTKVAFLRGFRELLGESSGMGFDLIRITGLTVLQDGSAVVAWVVHFPAGADALATDFSAKLAKPAAASAIWALSPAFQVYSGVTVAGVTSATNVSAGALGLDALNPSDTLTMSAPAPAPSSAGRASLALLAVGACAAAVLLLV